MQYYYRIFLWKNGAKQEELTKYVTVPIYQEIRMDGTVGTGKITLDAMPTTEYGKPYPPKTKIVIERYTTKDFTDKPKRWDYIVKQDTVEIYQGYPKLCNHAIELYDPTIALMDLHCDNIAFTYELHDVNLNYKTTYEQKETIGNSEKAFLAKDTYQKSQDSSDIYKIAFSRPLEGVRDNRQGTDMNTGALVTASSYYTEAGDAIEYYVDKVYMGNINNFLYAPNHLIREAGRNYTPFKNSYRYRWDAESLQSIQDLHFRLDAKEEHAIEFTVPKLICEWCNGEKWVELFEMPTKTTITRITCINGREEKGTEKEVFHSIFIPNFVQDPDNRQSRRNPKWAYYKEANEVGVWKIKAGQYKVNESSYILHKDNLEKSPLFTISENYQNKTIQFKIEKMLKEELIENEDTDLEKRYSYKYSIKCEPYLKEDAKLLLENTATIKYTEQKTGFLGLAKRYHNDYINTSLNLLEANTISIDGHFIVLDTDSNLNDDRPFIAKRAKYNAYDLLRKALLTTEAKIVDIDKGEGLESIEHSIVIDDGQSDGTNWALRLQQTNTYETIFEEKNFLEIVRQVACYLHAEPYVKFAEDGTDRLVLTFRELGKTEDKNNKSQKITVYNSYSISDFYTQLDSYVQNMFSPNNQVHESIVAKTANYGDLIKNDNAELHTKYGILEILEFDVTYKGETKSIKNHIFERSIYDTLPSNPKVKPSKASSLYFVMGQAKIQGLNYVSPSIYNGKNLMSLQNIIREEFKDNKDPVFHNLYFNDLVFHIKYRTQDSLRMASFNPHLDRYEKVSELDILPHNTQFFAQEDKIIDSERFAANLWGRLVRMANSTYTCNEYCTPSTEKEVGDLVLINNEMHYVIAIDQELYNEAILQKVRYSKNYNNFSAITGLPSEARFYEISERSMIRREMQVFDFFALTDKLDGREKNKPRLLKNWQKYIKGILFGEGEIVTPNYIYCKFQADATKEHDMAENKGKVPMHEMFPNCEVKHDVEQQKFYIEDSSDHRDVIVPLLQFTARNSLLFECDMEDNFKAGDAIDTDVQVESAGKGKYVATQSARYCDVFGGADLLQVLAFKNKKEWTIEQARRLPFTDLEKRDEQNNPIRDEKGNIIKENFAPKYEEETTIFGLPSNLYLGLNKDNREAISFNYQINLIDKIAEDRNSFVFFSTLFGKKYSRLKLALLNIYAPMFSETISVDATTIVKKETEKMQLYQLIEEENTLKIDILKENLQDIDLSKVKSLVWYDEKNGTKIPYIVKNLVTVADEEKLNPLYIISIYGKGE